MFWSIYIIFSAPFKTELTYIPIESFESRESCEYALDTRMLVVDGKYKFEFKCLKTDEPISKK